MDVGVPVHESLRAHVLGLWCGSEPGVDICWCGRGRLRFAVVSVVTVCSIKQHLSLRPSLTHFYKILLPKKVKIK